MSQATCPSPQIPGQEGTLGALYSPFSALRTTLKPSCSSVNPFSISPVPTVCQILCQGVCRLKGGPQPGGLCSLVGGDRHVSKAQSSKLYSSDRAVWDIQLRHQGWRTGKLSPKRWHLSCVLNPNQQDFIRNQGGQGTPGWRSLKCEGMETRLILGSVLGSV